MNHKSFLLLAIVLVGVSFSLDSSESFQMMKNAYANEDSKSNKENSGYENNNSEKSDSKKDESEGSKQSEDSKSTGNEKVDICHIPGGNVSQANTISVSSSAVDAHMAHGDMVGACPGCTCPPGFNACVCPDGTPGWPGHSSASSPGSQRELQGQ